VISENLSTLSVQQNPSIEQIVCYSKYYSKKRGEKENGYKFVVENKKQIL
jgi:hypothetical protein